MYFYNFKNRIEHIFWYFFAPERESRNLSSAFIRGVTLNTKNAEGKSERKNLEVDFVCNKGYDRVYVQSAFALDTEEKREQELRSLMHIKDSFQKVVITGGMQPTYRDENGILIMNLFDFLLDKVSF